MWRKAKQHDNIIRGRPSQMRCPGLKDHFKSHFNPLKSNKKLPIHISHPPPYILHLQELYFFIDNRKPTPEDITKAISKLKNNKSSLDVEGEILKTVKETEEELSALIDMIEDSWFKAEIPHQWRTTKINAIWKRKGSPQDPTKYRGISIGSISTKAAMNIILTRISEFYEAQLLDTQFGFRSGRGCNDGIYVLKQLQEISYQSQTKLFTCFVDLTAAYDHINRSFLFQSIRNRIPNDAPTTCIDILENFYSLTKSYLVDEDPSKDSFETTSGVRQGGNESPNLFNLYLDYAIRVYQHQCEQEGLPGLDIKYSIPNEATNRQQRSQSPQNGTCNDSEGGYADDIGIHAWEKDTSEQKINILFNVFKEFGLNVNISETETMIWNWNENLDGQYPNSILKIDDTALNNVKSFRYLGVWSDYNDIHIGETELNNRINSAQCAFAENRKLLTNRHIQLKIRVSLLTSLVRSRLTYGCHAWRPATAELAKLSTAYKRFLRSMVTNGYKRVNQPDPSAEKSETVDWRYVIKDRDLFSITQTDSIESFYTEQQHKWIAHTIRRPNNETIKKLTFHQTKNVRRGRRIQSILEKSQQRSNTEKQQYLKNCFNRK